MSVTCPNPRCGILIPVQPRPADVADQCPRCSCYLYPTRPPDVPEAVHYRVTMEGAR